MQFFTGDRKGRDREDKDDYKVKLSVAFTFSNQVKCLEYYHNSSFLEHGGSPDKAVSNAFLYAVDKYLKQNSKYNKNESKINFNDVNYFSGYRGLLGACFKFFFYTDFICQSDKESYHKQVYQGVHDRVLEAQSRDILY